MFLGMVEDDCIRKNGCSAKTAARRAWIWKKEVILAKILNRGIYCAKYYGQGGGEWCRGKKMKNEAVGNKMKKKEKKEAKKGKGKSGKEKEEKEKGESDFFVNIWHTSVDHHILSWHFMIP